MNARIVFSLTFMALVLTACGNKGPLVQAPVETPVEAPIEMPQTPPVDVPQEAIDDGSVPQVEDEDGLSPG